MPLKSSTGKDYFYKAFAARGYDIPRSHTNHIFVDLKIKTDPIVEALRKQKVYIRKGSDWKKPTCMRISIGTGEENEALMKQLKTVH